MIDRPPAFIPEHVLTDPYVTFRWDDWKASEDFTYDPHAFLTRTADLTPRSRIALTVALYEWVIWRLKFASSDPTPFQVAEGAWCSLNDKHYMIYYEFDRHDWMGPVRGPLWCAMTWLIPAVLLSDDEPEELESGLSYMIRLAHHVINDPAAVDKWIALTFDRLRSLYPAAPDDPFEDLFGERKAARLGPFIPQEALDPLFAFQPETTTYLIDRFLRTVDYASNPFLKSPATLLSEGFKGMPYRLDSA